MNENLQITNRAELLVLLQAFEKAAPGDWQSSQYDIFPGNKFITADYGYAPTGRKPVLEVIWEGMPFSIMLSLIRNNLPQLIAMLKTLPDDSSAAIKCEVCSHYQWQHTGTYGCVESWHPYTGTCKCKKFIAKATKTTDSNPENPPLFNATPQGPNSGVNAFFGIWPGEESDKELLEALKQLGNPETQMPDGAATNAVEQTYQVDFYMDGSGRDVAQTMIIHAANQDEAIKKVQTRVNQRGSSGNFHLLGVVRHG
ncbi:hypothetical protein C4588_02805 [Candidatus Parcubacteria bacterium]|nr:MAG: hypothetical protein C4588_02805 [Candidatus Parcubacteria bacterium]